MKYLGTRNEQYDPVVTQDISGKQDKATLEADVAAKGFTKNTGTYSKPAGGIPKTDLSDSVQASLGKADTALQEHQSLAAYRTAAEQNIIDNGKQDKITSTNKLEYSLISGTPTIPTVPTNVSYFTNDAGYLTLATLPKYEGGGRIMSATIKYKGNTIASITTDSSKTLKTSGKYCEGDIFVENVQDGGITPSGNKAITATTSTQTGIDVTNYATVSVAPTPSETKSVTTNGDVTPSSGKLLSKVTVNVPTGTARDSSDLTVSGATVNVPAGLYSSAASKSFASGTAGTPTASKSAVSNNSVTVTPSVTNTEGYITGGTKTGTGVKVSASELVSGNKAITPSETAQSGIDVTNFKTASVSAISSTYVGSGVTRKAAATVAPSTSEQTVCASGV